MEQLWAPWRVKYIEKKKPEGCIFCDKPPQNDDAKNYIVYRGKTNFVILNSFPYNPGHLMIAPYSHTGQPEDMTPEERHENMDLISRCSQILKEIFNPDGFNIGVNLGRVAGAGIVGHFHTHIVPRWNGDSNFMPVFFDVRVMPESLADTYNKLKGKF